MFDDEEFETFDDEEPRMFDEFIRMLESGKYSSIDELCNSEDLNYEDLYMDEDDIDKCTKDFFPDQDIDSLTDLAIAVGCAAATAVTIYGTQYVVKKILDKNKRTLKSK